MKRNRLFLLIFIVTLGAILLLSLPQFYTSSLDTPNKHFLNKEERTWLDAHKNTLKVGLTNIPNQVIYDTDKKPTGYAVDILKHIEKDLDISFQYIYFDTWDALMKAAKQHQIDIVFLAQKTQARLKYLDFTDAVLSQQNKIIIRNNEQAISTVDTLRDHKVAVVEGSALYEYLVYNYPQIHLLTYKNEVETLKAVVDKKADATILEAVRGSYYIEAFNINDLRVAETLEYDYHLRIASRRDLPLFSVILSKAVEHISPDTKQSLALKWGYVKDKERYFDKQTLIYLAIAFGIIIPFSLYLLFINRLLEKETRQHKETITKLHRAHDKESQLKNEVLKLNDTLEDRVKQEIKKNKQQQVLMFQQSRLAQMGEMIAMIAHQWRQPLSTLALVNQNLVSKYKRGKLDDTVAERFHTKSEELINHMSTTIDDFRNFFHSDREKKYFSINESLEKVLNLIENDGINIDFNAHKNYSIYGYPNEFSQALLNLITNAKDALRESTSSPKQIHIAIEEKDAHIDITIEDNAGGIPEDIIDKIFDPYFSTKENKNGTGLGLYIVKMIIINHFNADITVHNTKKGARFIISVQKRLNY